MIDKNSTPLEILGSSQTKDTVLIIEDDEINRGILSALLEEKFNLFEAENGKIGLDILSENFKKISIILLDLMMPVMDGYEFLQRISQEKRFKSIPVIILTANNADSDQIRALKLGASDFITKPYNPNIITNRIEAIIRLRRSFEILSATVLDNLTGVYLSQAFFVRAKQILKNHHSVGYDFVCTNIESFKIMNSRHGRKSGDKLLQEVAGKFKSILQKHEICGRISADRFMILLRHREPDFYKKLEDEITKIFKNGIADAFVLKFGICENIDHEEDTSSIYDNAMFALNSITRRYGKTISYFNQDLRKKSAGRTRCH